MNRAYLPLILNPLSIPLCNNFLMMKSRIEINQGDVLGLLIKKDRRKSSEIAEAMGYHVKYLPALINMNMLPDDAISAACRVFNVSPHVFSVGELLNTVQDIQAQNEIRDAQSRTCQKQIEYLESKVDQLNKEVESLRGENFLLRRTSKN